MADRYFVEATSPDQTARLTHQEAHHLAHVLRAKPGAQVVLFDGTGREYDATVTRVGRSEIELAIDNTREVDRELSTTITLAVALPKGDRQRWLVEKATELGVARLVPLMTERSNDRETESALNKLRRAVIEASKQCGRNRLMEIAAPVRLTDYLASRVETLASPDNRTPEWQLVAHPGGTLCQFATPTPAGVTIAIGPEGGFTNTEIGNLQSAGWQLVGLGTRILRIETAALALVARLALH